MPMPLVTLVRTVLAATALSGVGLATLAPSPANAQNTASPSARIDQIEREMRAMQDELRRGKADPCSQGHPAQPAPDAAPPPPGATRRTPPRPPQHPTPHPTPRPPAGLAAHAGTAH